MSQVTVGWREWAELPELGIDAIKMKVDTGARTSALHAFAITEFIRDGRPWVAFSLHPIQGDERVCQCQAQVLDRRLVTDSGGHQEERPVIRTSLLLGGRQWPIEVTLTDRETMKFRMLLGRTAMDQILVSPRESFLLGGNKDHP